MNRYWSLLDKAEAPFSFDQFFGSTNSSNYIRFTRIVHARWNYEEG